MHGKGVEHLSLLLSSISSQTFEDYEIIISDDSSNDLIEKYINNLSGPFSEKIRFARHQGPKSISANLNNAFKYAIGEVLKIIFQDDAFVTNAALEKIATTYKNNPSAIWCLESCVHTTDFQAYFNLMQPTFNMYMLLGVNTISSPSVLSIKRDIFPHFDTSLKLLMDVEFYFRQRAIYGDPVVISEPLIANRQWVGQSQNTVDSNEFLLELMHLTKKYSSIVSPLYISRARQYFKNIGNHDRMNAMESLISRFEYDARVVDRALDNDGERVDLNYYCSNYNDLDIYQKSHWRRYEFATALLDANDYVADMACGTGYGSVMMSRRCSQVDGYDIDSHVVHAIKERYSQESVVFINKSILELAQDSKYDKVISFETIEHLDAESIPSFFEKVYRALKPGGKFIFSTPYKQVESIAAQKFHRTFMIDEETISSWLDFGFSGADIYYQNYEDHTIKKDMQKKDFIIVVAAKPSI